MRYGLTQTILLPRLYGLKCSCKVLAGGTTRAAARPGRLSRLWGPHARNQACPPRMDRCKFMLLRACKPRRRLTSRTRRGRRPRVPKQWTGIFKVSNTCQNLCNNMVEEKAGVEKQNSKKGFEKNEHACIVEGVLGFRIFLPVWYLNFKFN